MVNCQDATTTTTTAAAATTTTPPPTNDNDKNDSNTNNDHDNDNDAGVCEKTLLRIRRQVGKSAPKAPNLGLDRSFRCWVAWPRLK